MGFSLTVSLFYFQFLAIILVIFIAEVSAFVLGFVYREKVNEELASLSQPKSKEYISHFSIIPIYLGFFLLRPLSCNLQSKWERICLCWEHGESIKYLAGITTVSELN